MINRIIIDGKLCSEITTKIVGKNNISYVNYPCSSIYFLMVSGEASPIEQTKYPSGKLDGKRIGGRYIGKDGQILHADCNAAANIALRSKLPCSISDYYAWQAKVNSPIVGFGSLQASIPLG